MPEKTKPKTVALEQCHPCGRPVRVAGLGLVEAGETRDVPEQLAERLLMSAKIWRRADRPSTKKPSSRAAKSSTDTSEPA